MDVDEPLQWAEALKYEFRDEWRQILNKWVPFYRRYDLATRERFEDKVKMFVLTKRFRGDGVEIDDRVKLLVAATAARLALNLPGEDYGRLTLVNVCRGKLVHGSMSGWGSRHTVAVAWESLLHGLQSPRDGDNVGYHEFAHVLDRADAVADGVPRFSDPNLHDRWASVLTRELERFRLAAAKLGSSVMDPYGATNEAEFFAVATETFFERPLQMRAQHPELYKLFVEYYRQDPAAEEEQSVP